MLFIIDPTHPPLKVDMASSVVECPRFSPSEMVTHLAHGNRYERSLRHMLTRNAKFNRIYSVNGVDEAPGFTSTHYTKPLVYGEEPYYCPNGWRRYSIDVGLTDKEFQQKYVSWPVAYHGTSSEAAASIILEGFKAFNYKSCYIKESDTAVYLTPSIKYAGHPRYAKVEKVGKLYMQIALQVRVKRDKFIKEPGTVRRLSRVTIAWIPILKTTMNSNGYICGTRRPTSELTMHRNLWTNGTYHGYRPKLFARE